MASSSATSLPAGTGHFVTTRWSVVASAQGLEATRADALETLCRAYWYPLYVYTRRMGYGPADAEDLTQGFFARLLEKDYLKAAAREKGRFRTFLLIALKRYLANEWDRQHAQKRGGFAIALPIDTADAESRFVATGQEAEAPDVAFDRQWAVSLLEQTLSRLQVEYVSTGRATLFDHLRNCLGGEDRKEPYAQLARQLNLTEAAFKMAVYRIRNRYRELLREQIAETVCSPEEVEDELMALFSAF